MKRSERAAKTAPLDVKPSDDLDAVAFQRVEPELDGGQGKGTFHVKRLVLAPVRAYQRWISPSRPRRCRYEPTCSAYAVEAVERFGIVRGLLLAAYRLLRCNPFSHGGFDPVPGHFTLRGLGHVHPADYHGEART